MLSHSKNLNLCKTKWTVISNVHSGCIYFCLKMFSQFFSICVCVCVCVCVYIYIYIYTYKSTELVDKII
jgi:hypothetical protein